MGDRPEERKPGLNSSRTCGYLYVGFEFRFMNVINLRVIRGDKYAPPLRKYTAPKTHLQLVVFQSAPYALIVIAAGPRAVG